MHPLLSHPSLCLAIQLPVPIPLFSYHYFFLATYGSAQPPISAATGILIPLRKWVGNNTLNMLFFFVGTIKETSGPLVIPLISKNKWREADKAKLEKKDKKTEEKKAEKDEKDLTIQERAAREILEESKKVPYAYLCV